MCHAREGWHLVQVLSGFWESKDPGFPPGLLSAGVTFFRGNDGNRARFAVTSVAVIKPERRHEL